MDNASGTANAKEITESMVITGIVVSDYVGNNINNHQIMLTDDTVEPGAGLMIRFKGDVGDKDTDYHLTRGSIVSFDLKGGFSKSYYDTYQVQFEADPDIEILDASDNTPEAIEVSDPAKLIDYQSQYVKVYSQPIESIRGEMYYNVSSGYANQTFETKNGSTFQLSFNSYSSSWANSIEIPAKAGYIKGCVSINQGAGNISPRNASDLEGMTEDLFTVSTEYTKTTIDQLGEGNYEIEDATIVGVHQKAVMFAQKNSGTVNYVLAFENNWQDQAANPYIGAVGNTATVKGESALRYGLYQFSNFEVTTGGDSSLALPEPETFDAEAIEKYASEIKADESKAAYKYVKVSGILGIEKGASYNTYTLEIPGLTTVETVAFAYGLDSYFEGLESGDVVDATGFALGYDTSNSKLNILLREIDANTTTPAVTFTKEPEPFAATDPQQQTLPYVVANVAASEVTFEIVGTNADKFTVVSHTDKEVVVNAAGNNETDAAYTATLEAKVAGKTLASVELKQSSVSSGEEKVYTWMNGLLPTKDDSKENYYYSSSKVAANGSEAVPMLRLGKSKYAGAYTTPALGVTGDKKLSFYAVGWKGADATVYIRVNGGGSVSGSPVTAISNDGYSGRGNSFTMTLTDDDYHTLELTGLTAESTITISTSENFKGESDSANKSRAAIIGLQIY